MTRFSVVLSIVLMAILSCGLAFAQPSAKVTAQAGEVKMLGFQSLAEGVTSPPPIFTQTIKTSEAKDLFIDVSLECGLTTNTMVMSKKLQRDIAEAEATVVVEVFVDGVSALPGPVTFARRYQGLIAEFAGDISEALSIDEFGAIVVDEESVDEEMLALILDTMSANSFNFIAPGLSAGVHTIEVVATPTYDQTGDQFVPAQGELMYENVSTKAYLGKGSVTVEAVRSVKGEDIEL